MMEEPSEELSTTRNQWWPLLIFILYGASFVVVHLCFSADEKSNQPLKLNPAAWGSDHVGKPVPEFMTGGECLFCHRKEIGEQWPINRHQLTIRPADAKSPAFKAMAASLEGKELPQLVLGGKHSMRFLRQSKEYGKLDLQTFGWDARKHKLPGSGKPQWDAVKFGRDCAGCHTTGVDPKTHAFSALSIDCYACHGDATLNHTKDASLVLLSRKHKDPSRVIVSICAQCHIRTGKSRSTGLPYPNNFVPGDNLLRDFQIDFEDKKIAALNPVDRHILENVRGVVIKGDGATTCLSCHSVHQTSTDRHEHLPKTSSLCFTCHESKADKWLTKNYAVHSAVCGY